MDATTNLEWKKGRSNLILQGDGFFISYNPDTSADRIGGLLTDLANAIGGDMKDGEETALCYDDRFDVLEGDFRKHYEKAFPHGLDACKAVFAHYSPTHRSNWTTA